MTTTDSQQWVQMVCDACGAEGGWMSSDGGWDPISPCPCGRKHRVCGDCRGDGAQGRVLFPVCPLTDEHRLARELMS